VTLIPAAAALQLVSSPRGVLVGPSVPNSERDVVFGGQLLGQAILAGRTIDPTKDVRSVHAVFARAGTVTADVEIEVSPLHVGRTMASGYVTLSQQEGKRTLCGAVVHLDVAEPDLLRAAAAAPDVPGPQDVPQADSGTVGAEIRIVGGVDVDSLAANGPAELDVWVRWDDPGDDLAVHQALASWFTDPWLIPAAMRPQDGVGLAMAHDELSTGVLTHTLTFHAPLRVDEWLLVHQYGVHAGGGRGFGEGRVFTEDGRLVASFSQTNMVRAMAGGAGGDRASAM
jgi:acyl-CoA thioesterase-2